MYAGSTTLCIHVPMLEANEPMNIVRKSRYDIAALALPGRKPCCGSPAAVVAVIVEFRSGNRIVTTMEIAEALTFIGSRHNGVLVTQRRDGRPQLSNISYGVIDGVIKISITAGRAKYHNISRNPQTSMHVTSDDFWAYAVIDGDAELSEVATKPDDPGVEELIQLYKAIVGDHPDWDDYRRAMVDDKRVVVRLRPTHAYGMLNR